CRRVVAGAGPLRRVDAHVVAAAAGDGDVAADVLEIECAVATQPYGAREGLGHLRTAARVIARSPLGLTRALTRGLARLRRLSEGDFEFALGFAKCAGDRLRVLCGGGRRETNQHERGAETMHDSHWFNPVSAVPSASAWRNVLMSAT